MCIRDRVYLIPVVLFLAGYVIMSLLTDSVAAQYAVAAAGFAAGIVFAIFYDRRLRARGGLHFNLSLIHIWHICRPALLYRGDLCLEELMPLPRVDDSLRKV